MNEPTLDVILRLEHLERENRRLKRIGGVVLVGLAAVVLMGQAMPGKVAKVVEAERFVVRDVSGNSRVELGMLADGTVALGLRDAAGTPRVALVLPPSDKPTLVLSDRAGTMRASVGLAQDGTPGLDLWDAGGATRVSLEILLNNGAPRLAFMDKDGKVLWKAP